MADFELELCISEGVPEMKDPIITLDNVTCGFTVRQFAFRNKRYEVIKGIDLSIHRGETLGIIGRNGAGKSTLLKMISGVLKPDSGRIIYHQPLSVSLLTMQLGFSPDISGRHNAVLSAMMLGHSKKEAMAKLDAIIAYAEAEKWIDDPLKTYSAGMRARLGFAVSMEMSPDVLLVDEALGVGDASFRDKSTKAMKEKMRSGQTVVFVSHDESAVKELCTRVAWIENGHVRKIGDHESVLSGYKNSLTVEMTHKVSNYGNVIRQ